MMLCTSNRPIRGRSGRKIGRVKLPKRKMNVGKLDMVNLIFRNRREILGMIYLWWSTYEKRSQIQVKVNVLITGEFEKEKNYEAERSNIICWC